MESIGDLLTFINWGKVDRELSKVCHRKVLRAPLLIYSLTSMKISSSMTGLLEGVN